MQRSANLLLIKHGILFDMKQLFVFIMTGLCSTLCVQHALISASYRPTVDTDGLNGASWLAES